MGVAVRNTSMFHCRIHQRYAPSDIMLYQISFTKYSQVKFDDESMPKCRSLTSSRTKYLLLEKNIALMSICCLSYLLPVKLLSISFPLKTSFHYIFRKNVQKKFTRNSGKQNAEIKCANDLVGASIYLVIFFRNQSRLNKTFYNSRLNETSSEFRATAVLYHYFT